MPTSFKKLNHQYAYLKLEKKEVEEICLIAESEIRKYMEEYYPEFYENIFPPARNAADTKTPPENQISPEEKIPTPEPKNKELKKIYHSIAQKCHPDKQNDGDSELFSAAAEAYANNDVGKLIQICSQIDVELNNLSEESLNIFRENINSLSISIEEKKESIGWAWHQTETQKDKEDLITFIKNNFQGVKND